MKHIACFFRRADQRLVFLWIPIRVHEQHVKPDSQRPTLRQKLDQSGVVRTRPLTIPS